MSPEIYPFHMRIHYTQNTIKGNFPRELYVCVVCVCVLAKIAFFSRENVMLRVICAPRHVHLPLCQPSTVLVECTAPLVVVMQPCIAV